MPNFDFLACFKLRYRVHAPTSEVHLHFTKSPKRDNIYLWMPEELKCLILTS